MEYGGEKMQSNHEAFINLVKKISNFHYHDLNQGNGWNEFNENSKLYYSIESVKCEKCGRLDYKQTNQILICESVNFSLQHVFDVIKNYGGENPKIIIYPLVVHVYTDDTDLFDKIFLFPLFCVLNDKPEHNEFRFIDVTGRIYSDAADFVVNQKFPPGKLAFPKNFQYEFDNDEILIEFVYTDTNDSIDKFELKRSSNWKQFITTMGLSVAVVAAMTTTFGTLPAFGAILGGTAMLYGDDEKLNQFDSENFQLGLDAIKWFDNFDVLLPKRYEIYPTTELMNLSVQRKMIIIVGRHYNPLDVNCNQLHSTLNKHLKEDNWQVFCSDEFNSFFVQPKGKHFFSSNILNRDFLIFVPQVKIPDRIDRMLFEEIKRKFTIKDFTDFEKSQNFNNEMETIAIRLCSNRLTPKKIVKIITEIFGGTWNCLIFSGYHSFKFKYNGYIGMKIIENFYCLYY